MKSYGQVQRETYNYLEAKVGCQIITMPPKIIDQVKGSNKSFNQLTIDAVKGFYKDAQDSHILRYKNKYFNEILFCY